MPTGAEIFREAGYYTIHSGKWHIGGMREEMRVDRANKDVCVYGSPNQHGFEEYTSALDGPESPRYTFLNRNSELHSKGHRHRYVTKAKQNPFVLLTYIIGQQNKR